jgi:hypothetical protein
MSKKYEPIDGKIFKLADKSCLGYKELQAILDTIDGQEENKINVCERKSQVQS